MPSNVKKVLLPKSGKRKRKVNHPLLELVESLNWLEGHESEIGIIDFCSLCCNG
jgi:hypothetical protein